MGLTRRDFFTLGIGAAAAIPLTPMPWKLLDDTAKWTQNWSWTPRPPRGEKSVRFSHCTLCPAGCGIAARCVGKNVVGIAPVAAHPVSKGVLCPYAFGAHQLPYHPLRINQALRDGMPVSLDQAAAEIGARVQRGTLAILDERPGRAVSAAYQRLTAARGGLFLIPERDESAMLQGIARASGVNAADLGLDLESIRTLVSFGAPVLESWATPGRVLTLWKEKRLAIVQVEAELSKTAALADRWVPATGQGAILPDDVLRFIHNRGPMLAIYGPGFSSADERAIAALNDGSPAIVRRGEATPSAAQLADVADGSIDVLIIDHGPLGGSVTMESLRPKLRSDGIVVSLSPYHAGVATQARFVIPTHAFGETLEEVGTPWDAAVPSYSVAPPLLDARAGAVHPLEFLHRVTSATGSPESLIRARVNGLHAAKEGDIFTLPDRLKRPVTEFKSADDLWKAFTAGACWVSRGATVCPAKLSHSRVQTATSLRAAGPAVMPPLFSKLYQESKLRRREGRA